MISALAVKRHARRSHRGKTLYIYCSSVHLKKEEEKIELDEESAEEESPTEETQIESDQEKEGSVSWMSKS